MPNTFTIIEKIIRVIEVKPSSAKTCMVEMIDSDGDFSLLEYRFQLRVLQTQEYPRVCVSLICSPRLQRGIDGNITGFKARWVVRGYLQQFGIDF